MPGCQKKPRVADVYEPSNQEQDDVLLDDARIMEVGQGKSNLNERVRQPPASSSSLIEFDKSSQNK